MADIVFLSAFIGGGKSLFGTMNICEEFRKSERMIVTNIPVFPEQAPEGKMTLGEWCHEHVKHPIDVASRFRLLRDDEVSTFYRHYPGGLEMPNTEIQTRVGDEERLITQSVIDLQWRANLQRDGKMPMGCLFVIDECHLHFGARDWQKVGSGIERYMSQLRKFNDDLILITQHPEKVDKNFRRNATEWIQIRNMAKTKLMMGVTLKGKFRFETYPVKPERGDTPTMVGWLDLSRKDYYKCYDTMAGVGLSGKIAPESLRVKGRHWSVWVVAAVILLALAIMVPRWVMYGTGRMVHGAMGSLAEGVKGKVAAMEVPSAPVQVESPHESDVRQAMQSTRKWYANAREEVSPEWVSSVIVLGYTVEGTNTTIMLSDGSTYASGDGHLRSFDGHVALVDGFVFRYLTLPQREVWESVHSLEAGHAEGGKGKKFLDDSRQ